MKKIKETTRSHTKSLIRLGLGYKYTLGFMDKEIDVGVFIWAVAASWLVYAFAVCMFL